MVEDGLVHLFNSISNFVVYLIPKLSLQNQLQYCLTHFLEDFTISLRVFPKVNVISRLEIELAYFEGPVQYFSHYVTGILHMVEELSNNIFKKKSENKYTKNPQPNIILMQLK